ncbi:MAG: hypothetical protein PQJ58_13380, partial [Spirochaetales bacterium]|nr:hypothetical protein [Spirochaetales bacterium]
MYNDIFSPVLEYLAHQLFKIWSKNVQDSYPDISFEIIDEKQLFLDLSKTIDSAIECIKKSHNYELY